MVGGEGGGEGDLRYSQHITYASPELYERLKLMTKV